MRASETAEMVFDHCRVHESQILGKEGEGFIQAMKILDGGRISIASLALGIAKGAYEASVKYAKERHQFGKPIKPEDTALIVAFLKTLTGKQPDFPIPTLPPSTATTPRPSAL